MICNLSSVLFLRTEIQMQKVQMENAYYTDMQITNSILKPQLCTSRKCPDFLNTIYLHSSCCGGTCKCVFERRGLENIPTENILSTILSFDQYYVIITSFSLISTNLSCCSSSSYLNIVGTFSIFYSNDWTIAVHKWTAKFWALVRMGWDKHLHVTEV